MKISQLLAEANQNQPGMSDAPGLGTIDINVDVTAIVANLIRVAYFLAALFFLIQLFIGGISWINAGGDSKALDAARQRITNAIIGLVIVVAAFAISVIVTSALNINIFTAPVSIF
jgi:hypothetical protein